MRVGTAEARSVSRRDKVAAGSSAALGVDGSTILVSGCLAWGAAGCSWTSAPSGSTRTVFTRMTAATAPWSAGADVDAEAWPASLAAGSTATALLPDELLGAGCRHIARRKQQDRTRGQ